MLPTGNELNDFCTYCNYQGNKSDILLTRQRHANFLEMFMKKVNDNEIEFKAGVV